MAAARFIPLLTAPGFLHMAIDRWLLDRCAAGEWSKVLRFYHWDPPALSLGYSQHRWPSHWQILHWQDQPLSLVRRPTGGRGVLHQGDLCYALVTQPGLRPGEKANRSQTYQDLCRFLQLGWQHLGFPLHYGEARLSSTAHHRTENCFALTTPADLRLDNGYKWIGSAQRWRSGFPETVLQHGSMRLNPDPALWQAVFGQPLGDPPAAATIPTSETIASTLLQAAERCFGTAFQWQPLSPQEWRDIEGFIDPIL